MPTQPALPAGDEGAWPERWQSGSKERILVVATARLVSGVSVSVGTLQRSAKVSQCGFPSWMTGRVGLWPISPDFTVSKRSSGYGRELPHGQHLGNVVQCSPETHPIVLAQNPYGAPFRSHRAVTRG